MSIAERNMFRRRTASRSVPLATKRYVKNVLKKDKEQKTIVKTYEGESIQDVGRTPIMYHITDIDAGDAQANRDGNLIKSKRITLSGVLAGADSTNLVRIMLIRSFQTDITAAEMPGLTGAPDYDRYFVLWDKKYIMDSDDPLQAIIELTRKVNHHCRYLTTAGTSQTNGRVYLYMVSDSTAVSDPTFSGYVRFTFTE